MEKVRVGVIGTGHIGTEHINRLMKVVNGSTVTLVSDVSKNVCEHILNTYPDISFVEKAEDLIHSDMVDAVLITCSNDWHAPYTMEAVKAGKPVFCEKPLGNTASQIQELMDAEIQSGRHLINVGFMRRFDEGYRQIKEVIKSSEMGEPLIAYCAHRNPGDWIGRIAMSDARAIVGSAIHEIDVMSWLFDEPFVSAQALIGKSNSLAKDYPGLHDPVVLNMKTISGIMVILEVNLACQYGYDIQCDVLSERGMVRMPEAYHVIKRFNNMTGQEIENTWKNRFRGAFDKELQAWIDSIIHQESRNVATTWDAYRAALMTDALIQAEKTGTVVECGLPECPDFYANL